MELYTIGASEQWNKWGDYGDILLNGIAADDSERDVRLSRTGPFVPPVFFPLRTRAVIVSEAAKKEICLAKLGGVAEFKSVVVEKVVSVSWQNWDRNQTLKGNQLPFNGEPEEYIFHNDHSKDAATAVGPLWSWIPSVVGHVDRIDKRLKLRQVRDASQEVFRINDKFWQRVFVNNRGKVVLEDLFESWISFTPVNAEIVD
ncbi:MAG: hypothetical protein NTU79_17935 [Planctomycetota bacterium]|nr:hypothetical protein [Planctomycetota bacterium]